MVWRLETERLLLRPPEECDVPTIVALIGDFDVAKNLSRVPHPYAEKDAYEWLAHAAGGRSKGTDYSFSIVRKDDGAHVGGCGLHLREGNTNEFGYWLGKPYWGNGYATEVAHRIVEFAFTEFDQANVWAGWYHDNPASGHVLEKIGCVPDGQDKRFCPSRGHDVLCNLVTMSRADYAARRRAA